LQTTDQKWQGVLHTKFSFRSHNKVGRFPASIRFRFTKQSGWAAVSKQMAQTTKQKLAIPTVGLRRNTSVEASPAPTFQKSDATKRKPETDPNFWTIRKRRRNIANYARDLFEYEPDNPITKEALQKAKADLLNKVLYGSKDRGRRR